MVDINKFKNRRSIPDFELGLHTQQENTFSFLCPNCSHRITLVAGKIPDGEVACDGCKTAMGFDDHLRDFIENELQDFHRNISFSIFVDVYVD